MATMTNIPDGWYLLAGTMVVEVLTEPVLRRQQVLRTTTETRFSIVHAEPVGARWRIWYIGKKVRHTAILEGCEAPQ